MKTLLTPTLLIACEEKYLNRVLDELPDGNYSVIGSVDKGVIDFDCEPYLKCFETYGKDREYTYQYIKEGFIHHTCSKNKAFIDLLESHSLSLDKKYLIIKPKN